MDEHMDNGLVGTLHSIEGFAVLFLERLRRQVELRRNHVGAMTHIERRLLDHAMYSSYEDCIALGSGYEAKSLIDTLRLLSGSTVNHGTEEKPA